MTLCVATGSASFGCLSIERRRGGLIALQPFRRDRLTWILYLLLSWYAFLQASPGLVVPHLRDEMGLSYSIGGLHVAAFAAGSMIGGLMAARLELIVGRRMALWSSAAAMAAGAIALTAASLPELTIASVLVMGTGGGVLLVTIQAALADHHGKRRGVALTEANVAASIGYLVLIGALSVTAAIQAGWRAALLVALAVPAISWAANRRLAIDALSAARNVAGRLPTVVWVT